MRILVAAASFSSKISGVQRHAFNLVRCLLLHPDISAVYLVVAPWQRNLVEAASLGPNVRLSIHVAEMDRSSFSRNLWYYRRLPVLVARLQPDLVHLSYPVPVDTASLVCPAVVSLHDLYPYEIPRNFGFPQVIFNRLVLRLCLRRVDAIACVSETTMLRMKQYGSRRVWRKAVRVYNCVEPEPLCAMHSPIPGWQGESFLLSVAQHRRNKNIPLVIRAFYRLLRQGQIDSTTKLVVVGISGPETRRIYELVHRCDLSRSVLFLEGLSEAELRWCYARCEALVVPSITEGFGLPVAEALLAGCRVVCSDIPAFREVGGEHCRFVALGTDAEVALVAGIVATLQEPTKVPVPLPHLSAEVLANEYVSLYRGLIPSPVSAQNPKCTALSQVATPERQSL
jgi:glycosyltransferase involved in cell wall biosynthesis